MGCGFGRCLQISYILVHLECLLMHIVCKLWLLPLWARAWAYLSHSIHFLNYQSQIQMNKMDLMFIQFIKINLSDRTPKIVEKEMLAATTERILLAEHNDKLQITGRAKPQQMKKQQPTESRAQKRIPREAHTQPYTLVNSYTQRPSWQFIVTVLVFFVQLALHSVFIPRAVIAIEHPILYVMWGIGYMLILVISFDYIMITCYDPADRCLIDDHFVDKYMEEELRMCSICAKKVHKNSYHCMRCDRCTEEFDHHCKYLNNCIGSQNYESFLRILLVMVGYNLNIIGQSIWVFVQALQEARIDQAAFSKWGAFSLLILSLIILITILVLLGFHIYINCFENMTTLQYIYKDENKSTNRESKLNGAPRMISADNLRK